MPFRNKNDDVLINSKWIKIYDDHKKSILEKRYRFENNLNIKTRMVALQKLMAENDDNEEINHENENEEDPYQEILQDPDSNVNFDVVASTVFKLVAIAKRKGNVITKTRYVELVHDCNSQ